MLKLKRELLLVLKLSYLVLLLVSCGRDSNDDIPEVVEIVVEEVEVKDDKEEEETAENCTNGKVYVEKDGIVKVDFESLESFNGWNSVASVSGFEGEGYIVWTGSQYFGAPGTGILKYSIKITNPGIYRFIWRSRITNGNDGTEHNDSWLRFSDAADFYGKKGDHLVYPGGTGKTPRPNGSSKEGWFKIYMNGAGSWKWASNTSDNDGHGIYVKFDIAGVYTMEISVRSSFHALDRFVLVKNGLSVNDVTAESVVLSELICKE